MIKNLIVFSDLHCGDMFGLCPPKVTLDGGQIVSYSPLQEKVHKWWIHFWKEVVPEWCQGEDYAITGNGDLIDGPNHHGTNSQITNNLEDQIHIAYELLAPVVEGHKFYFIRGTEAHGGKSCEWEEILAQQLGASPDELGNRTRWEMWLRLEEFLIHFSHHIGGTGSSSYESTAVYKEMVEAFVQAGRWDQKPPNCIVRSHRHRQFETRVGGAEGYCISIVTPGWQLKTPFSYRNLSGRTSLPQIGGYLIRASGSDGLYTRFKLFEIERSKEEVL